MNDVVVFIFVCFLAIDLKIKRFQRLRTEMFVPQKEEENTLGS